MHIAIEFFWQINWKSRWLHLTFKHNKKFLQEILENNLYSFIHMYRISVNSFLLWIVSAANIPFIRQKNWNLRQLFEFSNSKKNSLRRNYFQKYGNQEKILCHEPLCSNYKKKKLVRVAFFRCDILQNLYFNIILLLVRMKLWRYSRATLL